MYSSSLFWSARFVPSTFFVLVSIWSTHFFDLPFTAAHFLSVHILPRALRSTPCLDFSEDFSNHPSRFDRCPSLSSLFMSYLYRHPCLYLISTLRSRSIFILPLHALFRLPSSTRFTLDLPPSRSHIASLQLSWIRLCFSSPSLSFSFSSQPLRVSLFNITLRAVSSSFNPVLSLHLSFFPSSTPLVLSLSLLAISHQPTCTLHRRQAPVPCGLVLRARGCCEIIASSRPSPNHPRKSPRIEGSSSESQAAAIAAPRARGRRKEEKPANHSLSSSLPPLFLSVFSLSPSLSDAPGCPRCGVATF